MGQFTLVWDIETVPDLDADRRVHDLQDLCDEEAIDLLGGKFPKHPFHKIICIGVIIAERQPMAGVSAAKVNPRRRAL